MSSPSATATSSARVWLIVLAGLALAFAALHVVAAFTENVHWDEFAQMDRAARTAHTGRLHTGGRPGLGTMLTVPFADDCGDPIAAVRTARLLWVGLVALYLAGVFVLVVRVIRGWRDAGGGPSEGTLGPDADVDTLVAGALAVGLLALVPVFLRWSLHVRTDQPMLAACVWGTVALHASRRHLTWALVAGALFGAGYLFTQKAVYVTGLAGVIVAGDAFVRRDFDLGRDGTRAMTCVAGGLGMILGFRVVASLLYDASRGGSSPTTPSLSASVDHGLSTFEFYREFIGYRTYRGMLSGLIAHGALVLAALAALRVAANRRRVALGLASIGLGGVVGWFHAGAFPYFWMTLGLFFAVGLALAWPSIVALLPVGRARTAARAVVVAAVVLPAIPPAVALLADTQAIQRDSFAFVERNFDAGDRGFQPEGGLFCRRDPAPLPTYFSEQIHRRFGGEQARANGLWLIEQLRDRPVRFIVSRYRVRQFPAPVLRFIDDNYHPYYAAVYIAGRTLTGRAGTTARFPIIAAGRYRWHAPAQLASARVRIDDAELARGDRLELAPGFHEVAFVDDVPIGHLLLDVPDDPAPSPELFYSTSMLEELIGEPL